MVARRDGGLCFRRFCGMVFEGSKIRFGTITLHAKTRKIYIYIVFLPVFEKIKVHLLRGYLVPFGICVHS